MQNIINGVILGVEHNKIPPNVVLSYLKCNDQLIDCTDQLESCRKFLAHSGKIKFKIIYTNTNRSFRDPFLTKYKYSGDTKTNGNIVYGNLVRHYGTHTKRYVGHIKDHNFVFGTEVYVYPRNYLMTRYDEEHPTNKCCICGIVDMMNGSYGIHFKITNGDIVCARGIREISKKERNFLLQNQFIIPKLAEAIFKFPSQERLDEVVTAAFLFKDSLVNIAFSKLPRRHDGEFLHPDPKVQRVVQRIVDNKLDNKLFSMGV